MSMNLTSHHPPASHDIRPERPDRKDLLLEKLLHDLARPFRQWQTRRKMHGIVAQVGALSRQFSALNAEQLRGEAHAVSLELHRQGFSQPLVARSFALVREAATRSVGMRHFDCQLMGGMAMLLGTVAEMETGEGKTLTATLAAATAAMAGIPVHIISVNDYLTQRDAEEMGPVYRTLGLTVGHVVHEMSPGQRRQAYGCQVTYVTNKEIVFDYLRDRLVLKERVDPLRLQAEYLHGREERVNRVMLRGLHFALVDEADSILIDEARTPLIISGTSEGDGEETFLQQALDLAGALVEGTDYTLDRTRRQVKLKEAGRDRITEDTAHLGPLWTGLVLREGIVSQALTALHFFHRDEHYLVRDDKIQIVDEFTGRVMADRSWEQGLHQLIEVKEGCPLTKRRETLAKVSYQRFFRRYLRLAGMTGTAREVAGELWTTYRLTTLRIPTNRPVIRRYLDSRILPSLEAKWQAIIGRIEELHLLGRPVLVGTRSVAVSEHLSRLAAEHGLPHRVLNAKQDREEAQIVSEAGEHGRITIATNMAGRGTDIKLGAGVKELGGLHVIATERHEAARIDRQLAGRSARQGDPGSYEEILSLEDPLLKNSSSRLLGAMARTSRTERMARLAIQKAQQDIESYHRQVRKELFRQDQQQESLLSFSGRLE